MNRSQDCSYLSDFDIEQYLRRRLGEERQDEILLHLVECEFCTARVRREAKKYRAFSPSFQS